jgi:hypothetical protein
MSYHPTLRIHRPNNPFEINKQKLYRTLRFQRKIKKKKFRIGYILPIQQAHLYFNDDNSYLPLRLINCPKKSNFNLMRYSKFYIKKPLKKKNSKIHRKNTLNVYTQNKINKLNISFKQKKKLKKKYLKKHVQYQYRQTLHILTKRLKHKKLRTVYKR